MSAKVVAGGTWLIPLLTIAMLATPTLAETFDDCDALVRDAPDVPASYECYVTVARRQGGAFDESARRLDALLLVNPELYRAMSVLGTVERYRGNARAEELFLRSAALAREDDAPLWELRSRGGLATLLRRARRHEEAEQQLHRALEVAEEIGDPLTTSRVHSKIGYLARDREDFGRALVTFQQAEVLAFPDGKPNLKISILIGLASVYRNLGDFEAAFAHHARSAEVAREHGILFYEAQGRIAQAVAAEELHRAGRFETDELLRLVREAIEIAERVEAPRDEANLRCLVGGLTPGEAGAREFEIALEIATKTGDADVRGLALRRLGLRRVELETDGPGEGLRLIDLAIAEAARRGDRRSRLFSLQYRAQALLRSGAPREAWMAAYRDVLDAVEELRVLQPERETRARTLGFLAGNYYDFSGELLGQLRESPDPDGDLALAFHVTERMRARMLLDDLAVAGVRPSPPGESGLRAERAELVGQLSEVQRTLMGDDLGEGERHDALTELARLEAEERAVRDRIAREDPAFAELASPRAASISELQGLLAEDQAVLSYRVAPRELGGWVFVVTREASHAFEVPEAVTLRAQVGASLGLLDGSAGLEARAAAELYRQLLAEPLSVIPDAVERLVVVPDDALHRLPFGLLRENESGTPIATHFELSYVPSATLWAVWKEQKPQDVPQRALALADPAFPGADGAAPARPADSWLAGLRLGRLPLARREAREVVGRVGAGTILVDAEANESFLKQTDLAPFGIVHFAAHAIVDARRPERSAVVLSPGADDEDGLLQPREIVELDLDGKVVVLSACRSAGGEILRGEGVMSLAHAFFRAGARSVLATLRPLRDADATALFETLYERLADGASLSAALREAQREMIAAGAPSSAWSGVVVLGDGDVVPVPERPSVFRRFARSIGWKGGLIVWLAIVLLFLVLRLRRTPRTS